MLGQDGGADATDLVGQMLERGLPDFLADRDPEPLLEELLARLEKEGRADLDVFRRELNAELACHAAIKKHARLDPALAEALIRDLLACEVPHTCPHGRPVLKCACGLVLSGRAADARALATPGGSCCTLGSFCTVSITSPSGRPLSSAVRVTLRWRW